MHYIDIRGDVFLRMKICKQMIKKTIKEAENVKQPGRIKASLKVICCLKLPRLSMYLKLPFL